MLYTKVLEKIKTHFLLKVFLKFVTFVKIIWKNTVQPDGPDMTIKCGKEKMQFLISNFRRDLNVVCFLLGDSPASEFYTPTFRNTLSVPSSQAGRCVQNELGWGHVWGIIREKVWLGKIFPSQTFSDARGITQKRKHTTKDAIACRVTEAKIQTHSHNIQYVIFV